LSIARITMLKFWSAIFLFTHYFKISKPLVKLANRHLLRFRYTHVKPIS
jgi:hypothetical protein